MKAGVLFVLFFTFSSSIFAFKNEPSGFRKISWGTSISEDKDEMTLVEKGENTNFYERKGDKLQIGGAKLSWVRYGYMDNKLASAKLLVVGDENIKPFLSSFVERFGNATIMDPKTLRSVWDGKQTTILIDLSESGGKPAALVTFMSRRAGDKISKDLAKSRTLAPKANEADF